MQTTTSGWPNIVAQPLRHINDGVLMSWMRTTATGVQFFTINQSTIGGPDMIKGGGSAVTFFDKYFYTDYADKTKSWSVERKLGQFPYGTIMAQADVELDNTSKQFLPNFDPTIGSGILPNRPLKISVGFEGEVFKQFTGFTDQPENTLNNRVTTLHAFDAFDYINAYKSTFSGSMVDAPFQNIVASGLQEMGFSSSQYMIDPSLQSNIGFLSPTGRKWGDIIREGCEAEQGLAFIDENGIFNFWNRQHFTTLSGTQAFNLTYSKLADLQWQNTPVINDVIVRAKPRFVQSMSNVWASSGPVTFTDSSNIISGGEEKEVFINFTDEDGELPVTTVAIPEYSAIELGTSFFRTNTEEDGSGLDRAGEVVITSAYNLGNTYKLTFVNNGDTPLFIMKLVIYATPAKVGDDIEERYEDEISIATFGRNPSNGAEPIIIQNDLIQDPSTAHSLAYTLVKEYKDPRKRYIAPVAVGSNPAWQIGDYGTIHIEDTAEVKSVYITGIKSMRSRMANYEQVLELEERDIQHYFTINQSRIGGIDPIAP